MCASGRAALNLISHIREPSRDEVSCVGDASALLNLVSQLSAWTGTLFTVEFTKCVTLVAHASWLLCSLAFSRLIVSEFCSHRHSCIRAECYENALVALDSRAKHRFESDRSLRRLPHALGYANFTFFTTQERKKREQTHQMSTENLCVSRNQPQPCVFVAQMSSTLGRNRCSYAC